MSEKPSYPISISKLPPAADTIILKTDKTTKDMLAQACDVDLIKNLEAKFRFKRWRKHGVSISCSFHAEIQQECIATLEPVDSHISESFERQFLPERSSDYKMPEIIDGEMVLDPEADFPDIIESDTINLWDILIEEMILVIDPFPRAEAALELKETEHEVDKEPDQPTHKPFSELKALISEKKSNN